MAEILQQRAIMVLPASEQEQVIAVAMESRLQVDM